MTDYEEWSMYSPTEIDELLAGGQRMGYIGQHDIPNLVKEDILEMQNAAAPVIRETAGNCRNRNGVDVKRWHSLLSCIGVNKRPTELTKEDLIGKQFITLEDAELFFTMYARFMGFSVRKGHMRRHADGAVCQREWLCSCEGSRDRKFLKKEDRKREARALTRVGCEVVFRVLQKVKTTTWTVKEFKTDHSHTLAIQTHVQFLRSNRIVSNGALAMARTMQRSGIRTCHIMTFMAQQAGDYEYMPYLSKDLYNHIGSDGDVAFVDADAARAIGYLEHKKDHDSGFFGKYSYDGERRLLNLIWADTRCRSDFAAYGHAIAFDTTYKTNGYGKPLLIWVGINRHNKTTVLGFAILVNETVKTYK